MKFKEVINTNQSCGTRKFPKRFDNLFHKLNKYKLPGRLIFIIIGVISTVWFLIRVIPKPQRATYPCMQIAAPIMSTFVLWLLSITSSFYAFKKFRLLMKQSRYTFAMLLLLLSVVAIVIPHLYNANSSYAKANISNKVFEANTPVGEAKGVNPGRVVWVWNPDATNENTSNNNIFDYWYMNKNTNLDVVMHMFDTGIKYLADTNDIKQAWDKLFTWFNVKQGNGEHGYVNGEKIAIKLNLTNSTHPASYGEPYGETETPRFMDNTPQVVYAILEQLINEYGVEQNDIYIGDNFRAFRDIYWDLCHEDFPNVHYMDDRGTDGREKTKITSTPVLHFSDGSYDLYIPQHFVDATYIINLAALKSHNSGGITLTGKNNQGSILENSSLQDGDYEERPNVYEYAHASLPDKSFGYGKYRHLVDYTGHKDMGGKTVLNIIDGIWGGREFWGIINKWDMYPFNGDYPSSLFFSQDPVAIDAVCYDFLLEEARVQIEENGNYDSGTDEVYDDNNRPKIGDWTLPLIDYADDYLLQEASSDNWPNGFTYDPEGDGTPIKSLGVYEHWNNSRDMEYSRNLGTGNGIELIKLKDDTLTSISTTTTINTKIRIYPNPVQDNLNISVDNNWSGIINLSIINIKGQYIYSSSINKVENNVSFSYDVSNLPNGTYLIRVTNNKGISIQNKFIKQ